MTKSGFILLFLFSIARAEIPLELVEEIQLPTGTTAWDVQHWMDDSTYGMAWTVGGTLYYKETMSDSITALNIFNVLPDSFFVMDEELLIAEGHLSLSIVKSSESSDRMVLFATRAFDPISYGAYNMTFIYRINLSQETLDFDYQHLWNWDSEFCSSEISTRFFLWPLLPNNTERIFYGYRKSTDCEYPGGYSPYSHHCRGSVLDFETGANILGEQPADRFVVDPFATQLEAIAFGTSGSGDEDEEFFESHYRVISDSETTPSDTLCVLDGPPAPNCPNPVALKEATGAWRIVTGDPLTCYDTSGQVLWENEREADRLFKLRLPYRQSEVLISGEWNAPEQEYNYYVISVATGEVIDSLQPYEGELQNTIERQGFAPELITYSSISRTIRVYRVMIEELELTLTYLSESGLLVLNWNSYPGNPSYNIYRSSSSSVPSEQMDFVATTDTNYFELTPTSDKEFFRVTAVY